MASPCLTEYQECVIFVEYLETRGVKLFSHLAQSTWTGGKNFGLLKKNSMMGVRRGVPDYLVLVGNICVFVEMKRTNCTPSQVKPEQIEWTEALKKCPGVRVAICKGAQEAIYFVNKIWEEVFGTPLSPTASGIKYPIH